jgi:ubiquitin-protein ligase
MSLCENLPPGVITRLFREVQSLRDEPVHGVELLNDSGQDVLTELHAVITGPEDTPYEAGSFRVKLVLSGEYPYQPPRGYFLTKIFHPNVSEQGDICVNTLKRDWQSSYGIRHVLTVIRCLLIDPNPESALNEEAGRLLLEDYAAFAARARIWTEVHASPRTGGGGAAATREDIAPKSWPASERKTPGTTPGSKHHSSPSGFGLGNQGAMSASMREKRRSLKRL